MTMETMPVDTDRVVTRVEVIDHIGEAFTTGSLTRADLMAAASRSGARSAVVDLLGRLPDRKFSRPHDLWDNLADVSIEL
jgi:hypothetical protein